MADRLAVTGIQMICALGDDPGRIAQRLIRGEQGLQLQAGPWAGQEAWVGRVGHEFAAELGAKGWRHHSRASLMACLLGKRLLREQEKCMVGAEQPENLGLVLGYDHDLFSPEFVETIRDRTLTKLNPAYFLTVSTNAVASQVSIYLDIRGYSLTLTTGYTAGLEAVAAAAQTITAGRAKLVLAGGTEELDQDKMMGCATAFAAKGQEPGTFQHGLPGAMPAGEGCAWLRLENEAFAKQHGRQSKAFILGFGMGFNPRAQGAADPSAALMAVKTAMAGIRPGEVDAVFLSANGNPAQDQAEALALDKFFNGSMPPSTAIKSALGETFHAGGAMAAATAIACAEAGFLPPTQQLVTGGWKQKLNVSSQPRPWEKPGKALILALDQDYKACALLLEFP